MLAQAEFLATRVAEQTGDLVHQTRCTTYLAVIDRFRGEVEAARAYAQAALHAAETVEMIEYVAMASANLGWVAWREAKRGQIERRRARERARQAEGEAPS